MLDKRRDPRFACDLEVELHVGQRKVHGHTVDVSRGGLCLECDEAIPAQSQIRVQLRLVFSKDALSEPLSLPARIVWCTKVKKTHQIGASFAVLSVEQRQYLEMFLRYLRGEALAKGGGDGDDPADEPDPDAEPFA